MAERTKITASVSPEIVKIGGKEVRMPAALSRLVAGLRAGNGIISPHSLLMKDGAIPDLLPIVVSCTHGTGLRAFLTTLATICALKEESTGEHILTLSFNLAPEALASLVASYPNAGKKGEIPFEISWQLKARPTTSQST